MTMDKPRKFRHRRTNAALYYAKKKHRTDIRPEEWSKDRHVEKTNLDDLRHIEYDEVTVPLPRVHVNDITVEDFWNKYCMTHTPVILEGAMDDWPAMNNWSIAKLRERFPNGLFKVGEDDDGRRVRVKFKYFLDYMENQDDDSPLYLFQSALHEETHSNELLQDYSLPPHFPCNFLNLVGRDKKPPWRWFCIGPKRSGTTVHFDPLGTSAWNAVTCGLKRWVLFEPELPNKFVKAKSHRFEDEDDEAIDYFVNMLPRLKNQIKKEDLRVKVYDDLQKAGEIIFVPCNWWHGVVNLEDTVAITENYCGYDNFDLVWRKMRKQRKVLSARWLRNLRRHLPAAYKRAIWLDEQYPIENDSSSSSSSTSSSSSDDDDDVDFQGVHNLPVSSPWPDR
eukprot:GEMP01024220.1.p1 GENE.GEMP01024220.1~~GEMP01024220.1.p1  ORF type:complete len:402 (+),score=69.82 GEMP01024220.1:32-1207(+)